METINGLPVRQGQARTGLFTCLSCEIKFPTAELQRMHMKTEWHRYNLKRRVAGLPAVSGDVFQLKVLQQKAHEEQYDDFGFKIEPLNSNKRSRSRRTRQRGRRNSKKSVPERELSPASVASHGTTFTLGSVTASDGERELSPSLYSETEESRSGRTTDIDEFFSTDEEDLYSDDDNDDDDDDETSHEDDEPDQIPITTCFYCGQKNHEVEANVRHMSNRHGLYVPERSFLTDRDGLLQFLSDVIAVDHTCLKCGFEGKSLEGVRQHMLEKGHCVVPYETDDEKLLLSTFYNFEDEEEQEEDHQPSETSGALVTQRKAVRFADDDMEVDPTGVQLALPNGALLGNRKYQRYFRQDLTPRSQSEGERTVSCVYEDSYEMKAQLQKQTRQLGVIQVKASSRTIARQIKKCNKLKYYRDPML